MDDPAAINAYLIERVRKLEREKLLLEKKLNAVRRFIDGELREDYDEYRERLSSFDALDQLLGEETKDE